MYTKDGLAAQSFYAVESLAQVELMHTEAQRSMRRVDRAAAAACTRVVVLLQLPCARLLVLAGVVMLLLLRI
jgi:hypothetical protein